MKIRSLCIYYSISLFIIPFGLLYTTNYLSVNTLWANNLCPDSINAHKAFGVQLSLAACYNAQHGVQTTTIALVIGLIALSTLLFIIGLDINRTRHQKEIKRY